MLNRRTSVVAVLAAVGAAALLLAACGGAGEEANAGDADNTQVSSTQYPCEPVATSSISGDEAVAAAKEDAAHIIKDGEVRSTLVERMSFQQAFDVQGAYLAETPAPESCVWVVTLDGFFYQPPGPPPIGTGTRLPEGTICSRIRVIMTQDTGDPITLTFERMEVCG